MTSTLTYPSAEFPALPSLTVPRPEGWRPLPVAEALLAVAMADVAEGDFTPNVAVTNRRSTGLTLEEAARATAAALAASPGWEEAGRELCDAFGGRPSFRIEGAFSHPQAGTVYQAALITVVGSGPFTDLLQVVGTASASQAHECVPQIRAILQGARLAD